MVPNLHSNSVFYYFLRVGKSRCILLITAELAIIDPWCSKRCLLLWNDALRVQCTLPVHNRYIWLIVAPQKFTDFCFSHFILELIVS